MLLKKNNFYLAPEGVCLNMQYKTRICYLDIMYLAKHKNYSDVLKNSRKKWFKCKRKSIQILYYQCCHWCFKNDIYLARDINSPIHEIFIEIFIYSLFVSGLKSSNLFLNLEGASKCISQHH